MLVVSSSRGRAGVNNPSFLMNPRWQQPVKFPALVCVREVEPPGAASSRGTHSLTQLLSSYFFIISRGCWCHITTFPFILLLLLLQWDSLTCSEVRGGGGEGLPLGV